MALERYHAAFDIAESLSKESPTDSDWQLYLSVCHEKFADLHMIHGEFDLALKRYRASLDIAELLTKIDPVNTIWQRHLSVCYEKIGDFKMARGEAKAALEQYLLSLDLRERVTATDPTNASWQRDMFTILVKLADGGEDPVGRFSRSLEIFTRLEMERKLPSVDGWTNIKILNRLLKAQHQERQNKKDE